MYVNYKGDVALHCVLIPLCDLRLGLGKGANPQITI